MKKDINYKKYQRQIDLSDFGITGQKKLFYSKILIVGAGGLGCPVLQYLAAAGVGTIGVVDGDIIEESNLHRQILYSKPDIGKYKSQTALLVVSEQNPDCEVISHREMLTTTNVLDILSTYDIIVDGSDNYPTRYLVNDACVLLNKPLVYGAVLQFEGQVGVFNVLDSDKNIKTNYRDLFANPPKSSDVKSCNDVGVIGILPGIIGTLQAAEVIKLITGVGQPLCNKVLAYNMKTNLFYDFEIEVNPNKENYPQTVSELYAFNYDWFCSGESQEEELAIDKFEALLFSKEAIIVDIRESFEEPKMEGFEYLSIPMSEWDARASETDKYPKIILVCQSGIRSLKMVNQLKKMDTSKEVYSLRGGVAHWIRTR